MNNDANAAAPESSARSGVEMRRRCLEHADDLIASAERILSTDNQYQNIAYHLAILALEEIGKAGLLAARFATQGSMDARWIDKRLDDHVSKLLWAVWSPSMSGGRIDPQDFEDARRFAESSHERRMAGLYVDFDANETLVPPRQAVRIDHAASLLKLAKARRELEATRAETTGAHEGREELDWFVATISDEMGKKRLFSTPFLEKHEELRGDTRAWVRWAQGEFEKIRADEAEHLRRELARQASEPGNGRPKWVMKVRVKTPSHSLHQKTLNFWNERVRAVQLHTAGPKQEDLLLVITIHDHIKADQLFDFGLAFSKMHLAMLNIGTAGFFWYELSGQAEAYYESIQDLDSPHMNLATGRQSGLSREWSETVIGGKTRRRVRLEEAHLNIAIMGLAAYGPWSDKEAEPIFGQYLHGLMLLSKTDLHLSAELQARDAFLKALRHALCHFGDLENKNAPLVPLLHRVLAPLVPDPEHRDMMLKTIDGQASEGQLSDAVSAKRVTDLYLGLIARNRWTEFVERANQSNPDADRDGAGD